MTDTARTSPVERPVERVLWRGDAEGRKSAAPDRPGEILRLLSRAWRNVGLYGAGHPVGQTSVNDLYEFLQATHSRRPVLRVFVQEDTFFEESRALLEETLRFFSLLTAFTERLIGAVQLNAGLERREVEHLIEMLHVKPEELARRGGAEAYLRAGGVHHITVGSAVLAGSGIGAAIAETDPAHGPREGTAAKVDPKDAYRAGLRVMDELCYQASADLPLNMTKARIVVNHFLDILGDNRAAVLGLTALKNYDEDTYHHSVNVSILSLLLASELHMDRPRLVVVGLAGLLHDIGKVRLPRNIITKTGKLTAEEMEIVKRHPNYGALILRDLPDLSRLVTVAAFEHHAAYDLSGYPRIAAKKLPHLVSRIVMVADCFDAMTSARRVYRDSKRVDEAVKEIVAGAGTTFDPVLAKLFFKSCRVLLADAADATDVA
jgi:putative nucleotidyltransferase with HDIG domain